MMNVIETLDSSLGSMLGSFGKGKFLFTGRVISSYRAGAGSTSLGGLLGTSIGGRAELEWGGRERGREGERERE